MKTMAVGIGSAFLALAGAAILPVVTAILAASGGALVIVGLGAWRAFRKMRRQRSAREAIEAGARREAAMATAPALPPPVRPVE